MTFVAPVVPSLTLVLALCTTASAAPSTGFAQAMSSLDCASALALPASKDTSELIARAWCSAEQADHDMVVKTLDAVARTDPLIGWADFVVAKSALAAGNLDLAASRLPKTLPGSFGKELETLRFKLAVLSGKAPGAAPNTEAALFAATQGDTPDRVALLKVWTDASPGGFDAAALAAMGEPPSVVEDKAAFVARVKSLRKNHRHKEGWALEQALAVVTPPSSPAAFAKLGAAAFRGKDYRRAVALWARAYGSPKQPKLVKTKTATELFDYALAHARFGDYETASALYGRLVDAFPGDKLADTASYKLGYMKWDRGDCQAAEDSFDAHLKKFPKSKHRDEAWWFSAHCRWRAEDWEGARGLFQTLQDRSPQSSLVSGAAYWQARALDKLMDPKGARQGLERVLQTWPESGYAWFASLRLGHHIDRKPTAMAPAPTATLKAKPAFVRAKALAEAGLLQWAQAELRSLGTKGYDKDSAIALAWAWIAAGDARPARKLACPHANKTWKGGQPVIQQACTPRPSAALVVSIASEGGLDETIPFAVMNAESALFAGARSPADARGLMQLMPEVGERLHKKRYPNAPYDADRLFVGAYNASLGTSELVERRQSLDGVLSGSDLPAVIASYNAGEESVRRWLSASEQPEFDRWSEDIGYTETRRYVKRVLAYAMAQRWVYGDAN